MACGFNEVPGHTDVFTDSEIEMMGTRGHDAILPASSHACIVQVQKGILLGYLTKLNGECPT